MEFVNRALSLLQKKKKKGNTGCFFQAVRAMLVDSMQSVGHGLFKSLVELMAAGARKAPWWLPLAIHMDQGQVFWNHLCTIHMV